MILPDGLSLENQSILCHRWFYFFHHIHPLVYWYFKLMHRKCLISYFQVQNRINMTLKSKKESFFLSWENEKQNIFVKVIDARWTMRSRKVTKAENWNIRFSIPVASFTSVIVSMTWKGTPYHFLQYDDNLRLIFCPFHFEREFSCPNMTRIHIQPSGSSNPKS